MSGLVVRGVKTGSRSMGNLNTDTATVQTTSEPAGHAPVVSAGGRRTSHEVGLRRSKAGSLLTRLYGYGSSQLKRLAFRTASRLEGGECYSATMREILRRYHGVVVGAYSYGACMQLGEFPPSVTVGRYCSIAGSVRIFRRNHPHERLSTHPFFYNKAMRFVETDTITSEGLEIGDDTWIGYHSIICPGCHRIGIGAVIGTGAVVTKDVDDFAIVAGNPARLIRYRFPEEVRQLVRESRWWEKPVEEVARFLSEMVKPLEPEAWRHPLLKTGTVKCK